MSLPSSRLADLFGVGSHVLMTVKGGVRPAGHSAKGIMQRKHPGLYML